MLSAATFMRSLALLACLALPLLTLTGCGRPSSQVVAPAPAAGPMGVPSEEFLSLMNAGKNYLDQGDATNALVIYRKAEAILPQDLDLRLNLASASLMADATADAIREAQQAIELDANSAAAYFILGSAHLRLLQPTDAVKALENARRIDPGETATYFQLGKARMELKQWDEAIGAFKEGLALDPNHLHAAVHYLLGQSLLRAGRQEEARQELQQHQAGLEADGPATSMASFEKSRHTQARVPFKLEQPDPEGIRVRFTDATREVFGDMAGSFSGPVGILDPGHTGWNGLFVVETGKGFRWLRNTGGTLGGESESFPAVPGRRYSRVLVGDLQNDRFEDIVVLGDTGTQVFRFGTNGVIDDVSAASHLDTVTAVDGMLMDLDFLGKLDLVTVTPGAGEVQVLRQSGPLQFTNITAASGIPATLRQARTVTLEDWNRDGNADLLIGVSEGAPILLEKQRGGRLKPAEARTWAAGPILCTGDFDNDLRPDLVVAGQGNLVVCHHGGTRVEIPQSDDRSARRVDAFDYDNDGWLDLWLVGETIRVWRNRGLLGFQEQTKELGLDRFEGGPVSSLHAADFDRDCDLDLVVALAGGGLRYLRNEGGDAQSMVKVHLIGNRSNASGIGCKVEIQTGGLRLVRTVKQLPVEVGVGRHTELDSFLVHWFNWPQGDANAPVDCQEPLLALEATIQEGSCPYLYVWDGQHFEFLTDILGAAPIGLPVAERRYIEPDPEELVWIGNDRTLPPRNGSFEVRVTEELREVLYLDEAKLVVVDHAPGVEVHATDKLLPGGPFPAGGLMPVHREHPLLSAVRSDGQDVTARLRQVDHQRASPPQLRVPQLRGLAETHGYILDFGPLEVRRPLVLVLNGWLRFGGGMANVAASHDPSLPFPFPALEAEISPGIWEPVDVVVGAPAGKTKTILVDLTGRLKVGTRRLRLTQAFEIHWDRIALMERFSATGDGLIWRGSETPTGLANATALDDVGRFPATKVYVRSPSEANLRFRGFSRVKALPSDNPLTPDYQNASANSCWTVIPEGWCTRYGDVSELVASRDEGLALIHAGDELGLRFRADALPDKPAGTVRDFFLYVDGWDKDSDFHVAAGTQLEPLPFHGMDAQAYGSPIRPAFPSDVLHQKFNTRWVDGRALRQVLTLRSKE